MGTCMTTNHNLNDHSPNIYYTLCCFNVWIYMYMYWLRFMTYFAEIHDTYIWNTLLTLLQREELNQLWSACNVTEKVNLNKKSPNIFPFDKLLNGYLGTNWCVFMKICL